MSGHIDLSTVRFDETGLVPVVAQGARDGRVLMLAYADRDALQRTASTGWAHYYSRSRGELWEKGATSGNRQAVKEILLDCDCDAVLYRVIPDGPACHTGEESCFFRTLYKGEDPASPRDWGILEELVGVIESRKRGAPEGSYISRLLADEELSLRKIPEEATEVLLAALDGGRRLPAEMADLWFHCLVLLARCECDVGEVLSALRRRRPPPS